MTSTTDLVLFSQALLHKSARKIVHDILLKIFATPRECAACSLSGKSAALPLSRSGKEVISCATARARIASIEAMIG